jgi:SAM-dependent methyltransferase
MSWDEGYVSDVQYPNMHIGEQSPTHLNFACILNGYEPVSLDGPFTYFELGCGQGLTANILAASNPHGKFYATDFNPAHIVSASELAKSAGLNNLVLMENSFFELAEGMVSDLPKFDFITMHGVYTWVNADNRQYISRFLARYLKPGGLVYVSYNAMPGWSNIVSLQRLMREHVKLYPAASQIQIKKACQFASTLSEAGANYFKVNPVVQEHLDSINEIKSTQSSYLVHEYMHQGWAPLYHADIVQDFSIAKLDYVGSADFTAAFPHLLFNLEQKKILNEMDNSVMRETCKDYIVNASFRKDIFVRGARSMSTDRMLYWMDQIGIVLTVPRHAVHLDIKVGNTTINGREEIFTPIFDALTEGPKTLAELALLPALKDVGINFVKEVAGLLCDSKQASPYFVSMKNTDNVSAINMNRMLTQHPHYNDGYQVLASSLLGNGVLSNPIQRVAYQALLEGPDDFDVENTAKQILKIMKNEGIPVKRGQEELLSEEDQLAELVLTVSGILNIRVPIWRALKMTNVVASIEA